MSALSFRLNRVFRPLLHGVRSARPEEVETFLFPASPSWPENEMTGTDCPSAEAPVTMTGIGYRMVIVAVSSRRPLATPVYPTPPAGLR